MTTPVTENAAALAPWASLTRRQQEVLLAIEPMKTLRTRNGWLVRGTKASQSLVNALETRRLVREQVMHGRERLMLTEAGKIAAYRLEERRKDKP